MNKLGINSDSSGRRGERTRLRNQMDRLFNSTVQFIYEPKAPDGASLGVKDTFNSTVARKTHLVWNPKKAQRGRSCGRARSSWATIFSMTSFAIPSRST